MRPGVNEVYRMDSDGGNVSMLTNGFVVGVGRGSRTAPYPRYDCPVWSPDGRWLAAVLRLEFGNYLALIPADGKSTPKYYQSEVISAYSAPVWVPKNPKDLAAGASDLLLIYPQGIKAARLVAWPLDGLLKPAVAPSNSDNTALAAPAAVTMPLTGWHDMEGLTLSPDGSMLAGMVEYLGNLRDANNTGVSIAELRVYDAHTFTQTGAARLVNFDALYAGRQSLFWLTDQQVGIARLTGLIGPGKTVFERFYPQKNFLEAALPFEDGVIRPALSEGNQVLFTSESGLWAVNLSPTPSGGLAVPRRLSGEPVFDLDWR